MGGVPRVSQIIVDVPFAIDRIKFYLFILNIGYDAISLYVIIIFIVVSIWNSILFTFNKKQQQNVWVQRMMGVSFS